MHKIKKARECRREGKDDHEDASIQGWIKEEQDEQDRK